MRQLKLCCLPLLLAVVSVLFGCGGGGPEDPRTLVAIKGKVVADGEPIAGDGVGLNIFLTSGAAPTSVMLKADGTFEGEAAVGANKVVVFMGASADGAHVDASKTKVAKPFMDESLTTLTATVDADSSKNDFTFDVGAKAAKASGAAPSGGHAAR